MEHITQEQKLGYISNRLEEEVSFAVDEHLADCAECVSSIRALRILRHDFDRIWDGWTAKAHSQAYREAQFQLVEVLKAGLVKVLETAAKTAPALQERIQRWLRRIKEIKVEPALHLILDPVRKIAQVPSEGLEGLRWAGSLLHFEPALALEMGGPPVRTRGPAEADQAKITLKAGGPPWVQVNVDARAGKVSVLMDLQEEPWPLLLLQPIKADQAPMVREFRRPPGMDFLLAEFEGLPGGEYLLLSEPLSQEETNEWAARKA